MIDWTHWHNEPFLIGGIIFLGWLYALAAGPLRARLAGPLESYPRRHAIKFYTALALFYLAVGSPLDQIGERFLFSAHMLQHQIMIYPAAILFLLGLPAWMVRPLAGPVAVHRLLRFATRPIICGIVYTLVVSLWHLPFLYDQALQNRSLHILEHFMFFGAALLYWWPLYSPSREFPPASYAVQMIYIVAVAIGMTPVFAYITFSTDILYPTYEFAPRVTWMTPADDQLLAGSSMKLVGFGVAMTAFAVSFYRWNRATEMAEGQVNL